MMSKLSEQLITEIRNQVDIVEIIEMYVTLQKKGNNYTGLCPFHTEKSPSFTVTYDKQLYHCFGCGAGGNVINFLMDIEGMSFNEAIHHLAKKGNSVLPQEYFYSPEDKMLQSKLNRMFSAHQLLSELFQHILLHTEEGEGAFTYLLDRGFTRDVIERFQIGYALDSVESMVEFLRSHKYSDVDMEEAGLIKKIDDGKSIGRFRNRIMFPITNNQGQVVGFSGRTLGESMPKYLNSPETQIFNKHKLLYNFANARKVARKENKIVLFEGFMDVISASVAGIENSVATMGTSLSREHVQLLKRNVEQVILCFDGDRAGLEANLKIGEVLLQERMNIKVASFPGTYDPDEYIRQFGGEIFQKNIIKKASPFMRFKINYFRRDKNMTNEGDKITYIERVIKEIAKLSSDVERSIYCREISDEFKIPYETILNQVLSLNYYVNSHNKKNKLKKFGIPTIPVVSETTVLKPKYEVAGENLLLYMVKNSEFASSVLEEYGDQFFNIEVHNCLFREIIKYFALGYKNDANLFINYLQDQKLRQIIVDALDRAVSDLPSEQEIIDNVDQINLKRYGDLLIEKHSQIKDADFESGLKLSIEVLEIKKTIDKLENKVH